MQAYSKQLGRMLVQEIGKEEKSAKARGGQQKKHFWHWENITLHTLRGSRNSPFLCYLPQNSAFFH